MPSADEARLLAILAARFATHPGRHPALVWAEVEARLTETTLRSLAGMERTGGEPDVTGVTPDGRIVFTDCAPESPSGRRSLCFDDAALAARKENKPEGSAMALAAAIGIDILTEEEYRHLQTLGELDRKTSSWIATPAPIRSLGGALFCDRRYDTVFTYHNGADSYYAARGFRGRLIV